MGYEHLLEIISIDSPDRILHCIGPGYTWEDLTEDERKELIESERCRYKIKINTLEKQLWFARRDFEKLRDIPNLPEEAIYILKDWTYRDGDDDEWGD